MPHTLKTDTDLLLDKLFILIQEDQDYSEEDITLFKNISVNSDENIAPNKYFVRLTTAEDITLDFICENIYTSPRITETEFNEWPLDFSKY